MPEMVLVRPNVTRIMFCGRVSVFSLEVIGALAAGMGYCAYCPIHACTPEHLTGLLSALGTGEQQ